MALTLKFLFIPQATLAVVFLVVFCIMLLYGIYLYWHCGKLLKKLEDDAIGAFAGQQNKLSPDMYLKIKLASLSDEENKLEGLSNVFVSVGILATFIGLGVAIQGAAGLLNEDVVDLRKMTDILEVISFKFQTSVWGIFFSLLFHTVFVNSYLTKRQDLLDKLTVKLQEQDEYSSRLLLADILEKIGGINYRLDKFFTSSDRFVDEVHIFDEHVVDITNKFVKAEEHWADTHQEITSKFFEQFNTIHRLYVRNVEDYAKQSREHLESEFRKILSETNSYSINLQKAAESILADYKAAVNTISEKYLQREESLRNEISMLKPCFDAGESLLNKYRKTADRAIMLYEQQKESAEEFNNHLSAFNTAVQNLNDITKETKSTEARLSKELKSLQKQLTDETGKITDLMNNLQTKTEGGQSYTQEGLKSIGLSLERECGRLDSRVQSLDKKLSAGKKEVKEIKTSVSLLNDKVGSVSQQIREVNNLIDANTSKSCSEGEKPNDAGVPAAKIAKNNRSKK